MLLVCCRRRSSFVRLLDNGVFVDREGVMFLCGLGVDYRMDDDDSSSNGGILYVFDVLNKLCHYYCLLCRYNCLFSYILLRKICKGFEFKLYYNNYFITKLLKITV